MSMHTEIYRPSFLNGGAPGSPTTNGSAPQLTALQRASLVSPFVQSGLEDRYGYGLHAFQVSYPYPKLPMGHCYPMPYHLLHNGLPVYDTQTLSPPIPSPSVESPPSTFPPEQITKRHTSASFSRSPVEELEGKVYKNWTLTLPITIPEGLVHPTLASLSYAVKYSTGNNQWTSIVQTAILLASEDSAAEIPESPEITFDEVNTPSLNHHGVAVGPELEGETDASTLCLLSSAATKPCEQPGQWKHYVDSRQSFPNVRITDKETRLYLRFHVVEYPSVSMTRSLAIDASATWFEDLTGRRLVDELEQKTREAEEARRKAEEEAQARVIAEARATAADQARGVAERERDAANQAAARATEAMQAAQSSARSHEQARHNAEANARNYEQARRNAEADAAKHRGARQAAEARAAAAEKQASSVTKAQERIKKALEKLPDDRRCSKGFAWKPVISGYRCKGGAHYLTKEEWDAVDDDDSDDDSDDD